MSFLFHLAHARDRAPHLPGHGGAARPAAPQTAAHAGGEAAVLAPPRPRAGARPRAGVSVAPARSRDLPGRARADRALAALADGARDAGGAGDHFLRLSDRGAARGNEPICRVPRGERRDQFLRSAAARYGAGFWEPGAGIMHQVVLENYAFPGQMIIGTDSHTPNAGGLGACAMGVGGADAVEVLAGLPLELLHPRSSACCSPARSAAGRRPRTSSCTLPASSGWRARPMPSSSISDRARARLSATGKATIANMGAELGATTSLFPVPTNRCRVSGGDRTRRAGASRREISRSSCRRTPRSKQIRRSSTTACSSIDLSTLEPHVVGPHSPDRARPISQLAAEVRKERISRRAVGGADRQLHQLVVRRYRPRGRRRGAGGAPGMKAAAPLLVTPGSERVRATIERDGQLATLRGSARRCWRTPAGPASASGSATTRPATTPSSPRTTATSRAATTAAPTTMAFIASPEIVTALALGGQALVQPAHRRARGRGRQTSA